MIEDEKIKMKSNIHLLGKFFIKLELISDERDNRFIKWLISIGLTLTLDVFKCKLCYNIYEVII